MATDRGRRGAARKTGSVSEFLIVANPGLSAKRHFATLSGLLISGVAVVQHSTRANVQVRPKATDYESAAIANAWKERSTMFAEPELLRLAASARSVSVFFTHLFVLIAFAPVSY